MELNRIDFPSVAHRIKKILVWTTYYMQRIWFCKDFASSVVCRFMFLGNRNPKSGHKSLLGYYFSSGSRNFGEGGPRNMTYKPPRSAAIFIWPIFTSQGGHGPLAPPGSATENSFIVFRYSVMCDVYSTQNRTKISVGLCFRGGRVIKKLLYETYIYI